MHRAIKTLKYRYDQIQRKLPKTKSLLNVFLATFQLKEESYY